MVRWVLGVIWHGFWFFTKAFFALIVLMFMTIMVGCSAL